MAASSPPQQPHAKLPAPLLLQRMTERTEENESIRAIDKLLDQCKQAVAGVHKDMSALLLENRQLREKIEVASHSYTASKQGNGSAGGALQHASASDSEQPASASVDQGDQHYYEVDPPGAVSQKAEPSGMGKLARLGSSHDMDQLDSVNPCASAQSMHVKSQSEKYDEENFDQDNDRGPKRGNGVMTKNKATLEAMEKLRKEQGYFCISPKWQEVHDVEPARLSALAVMTNKQSRKVRTKVTWVEDKDNSIAIAEVLVGEEPEVDDIADQSKPCRLLLRPDEPLRGVWDIISVILVFYDIIVLPLQLLDLPEDNTFLILMAWVTRLFWTFDIALSFCSGYVLPNGSIVMEPKLIVKKYLKTWFLLDALIVGVDWFELSTPNDGDSTASSAARFSKASRGVRALRMLRLLRLLRIGNGLVIQGFFALSAVTSEKMLLAGEILKIVLALLMISHCTGCLWYGVGAALSASKQASWVDIDSLQEKSVGEKYIASMHWSLAYLQGGMDEFPPRNPWERFYSVIILVITFLVSMGFLSRLTSSLTQLHIISSEHEEGLRMLRSYLSQNNISGKLAARISRSVKHNLSSIQNIPQEQVKLLAHVSTHLRSELYFEIYGTILCNHFFFSRYIEECPQVMRKVCRTAITAACISTGDLIFSDGERPQHPMMYILESGSLVYLAYTGRTAVVTNKAHNYDSSHFISEGVLWTAWVHMGMLKAANHVQLYEVDATKFQSLACEFHHTEFDPRVYAINFIKLLNWSIVEDLEVTDLSMEPSASMLVLDYTPSSEVEDPPSMAKHQSDVSHLK